MKRATIHTIEGTQEVGGYPEGSLTASELLTELSTIQSAFRWQLTKQKRIRGTLKNDSGSRVFDPITAVAFCRTGKFFPEGRWLEAAHDLGLIYGDCAEIVAACNYDWDPSCRQGALRYEFMKALNVEPTRRAKAANSSALLADTFSSR